MAVKRGLMFVLGTAIVAGAAAAAVVACKDGGYDGSYDGGYDTGTPSVDGSVTKRVVQSDKVETLTSADGALEVTFAAGTFAAPTSVSITTAGERLLEIGLVVPIYVVAADTAPAKAFQVSFRGSASQGVGNGLLMPAQQKAGAFEPLAITGTLSFGGSNIPFWGLTKTLGTFSLAYVPTGLTAGFADTATSCTAKCCAQKGGQVTGHSGGCFCTTGADLACFLEQCADIDSAGARCSAIATGAPSVSVECTPMGVPNCPGPGCPSYNNGACGGAGSGGGPGSITNVCCIRDKSSGTCESNTCPGFAARCTATSPCPSGTECCVFAEESYCAKDCPTAQRACSSGEECADAGVDAGCQAGGCPVGVCGTPPTLCH